MAWITHRQPTESDGDNDGDVHIRDNPNREGCPYVHWSYIGLGVPWRHSKYWTPRSEPEPAPAPAPTAPEKPALAVGQTWKRRDGEVVTIKEYRANYTWPFLSSTGNWHTPDGYYYSASQIDELDLIELISETPEPAPEPEPTQKLATAPRLFWSMSRTVNPDGSHTIDAIDDRGVAWWMVPGEIGWQQLAALPVREVKRD